MADATIRDEAHKRKRAIPHRHNLSQFLGTRRSFTARLERFGFTPAGAETALLLDVVDIESGVSVDHAWIRTSGAWAADGVKPGAITLDALVVGYRAGYRGNDIASMIDNPSRKAFGLAKARLIGRRDPTQCAAMDCEAASAKPAFGMPAGAIGKCAYHARQVDPTPAAIPAEQAALF